jgi:hypothetical protein
VDPLVHHLRTSAAQLSRLAVALETHSSADASLVAALRDLSSMGHASADTLADQTCGVSAGQRSALGAWVDAAALAVQLAEDALLRTEAGRAS